MSKAFTRESDDTAEDLLVRPLRTDSGSNYITRHGADRLRHQLESLVERKRAMAVEKSTPDQEAGLRRLDGEIQRLQATLGAIIVADPPSDTSKVALGASVAVRDREGDEDTYEIVGVSEADPARGLISSASPLGRALMNRKAGEHVQFQTPAGTRELIILTVSY